MSRAFFKQSKTSLSSTSLSYGFQAWVGLENWTDSGAWQKRFISRRSQRQFGRGRRRLKGLSQLFQTTPASSQLASRTTR